MQHTVVYTDLNSGTMGRPWNKAQWLATVVMGRDYDCDVAMSRSCIYHCAYTSERVGQCSYSFYNSSQETCFCMKTNMSRKLLTGGKSHNLHI